MSYVLTICLPLRLQNEQFPYCQSWVLGWQYRKQNLLKELLGYSADIVCLQEVRHLYISHPVQCLLISVDC